MTKVNQRTGEEKDKEHVAVLLEDLSGQFTVFGEGLQAVKKQGKETFKIVGEIKEDVEVLKVDMQDVKDELHIIRNELKEKVGRDEFITLEGRVARLEKAARAPVQPNA